MKMAENENRRSKLTRRLFRDSLKELLLEKEFGRISVNEICKRADMNRSTFYAHYEDQFALMREVEDEFLDCVKETIRQTDQESFYTQYLEFLRFIYENGKLFLLITTQNGVFRDRIIETACTLMQSVGLVPKDDPFSLRRVRYAAAGSLWLVEKWVAGSDDASVEDMADLLIRLYGMIGTAEQAAVSGSEKRNPLSADAGTQREPDPDLT